ncbi:MAG: type I 3-dehydroquinate dehydratase [Mariprofundaceae bacterium]|nr:type I 3-dehydroquinate dehydratase [Mariprofundaceae bacterium]
MSKDAHQLCLGSLDLGGNPRLVVGYTDDVSSDTIKKSLALGLDVAELRVDKYAYSDPIYVLNEISKFRDIPTIATIRSSDEGGDWCGTEAERLSLFKTIISHVDAIDIELLSKEIMLDVIETAHEAGKLAVVSYHNFKSTPSYDDLVELVNEAKKKGADIVKIACTAISQSDMQNLARLTIDCSSKNIITIAMGSKGLVSRLMFPALGSLMTFAYVGRPTATGQLRLDETLDLLRLFYPEFNEDKIIHLKLLENM